MIKRYIGEEASEYIVVGLLMMTPEADPLSGCTTYKTTCILGDDKNPIKFLHFFEQAQHVKILLSNV